MFNPREAAYLSTQHLARLATVALDGTPTVDAVGFQFDGSRFYVGGYNLQRSRKYRNIAAGNQRVALIIDDLEATEPWTPRGIKLHGTAEIVERDGFFGPGEYFVITPLVSWSWGVVDALIEGDEFVPHKVDWTRTASATG